MPPAPSKDVSGASRIRNCILFCGGDEKLPGITRRRVFGQTDYHPLAGTHGLMRSAVFIG